MDNFDKRIKQIAKDENWEIPNEIDNNISKLLKNIEGHLRMWNWIGSKTSEYELFLTRGYILCKDKGNKREKEQLG